MRILITIEYNGKDFFGWQIQPGLRTVQGVLTDALTVLLKEKITLHGSGRTDAGVHALNQKAHFDYHGTLPVERLPLAVNTSLPPDVKVKDAVVVSDDFEVQFDAKKKTYRYRFYLSRIPHPLSDDFSVQLTYPESRFDMDKARHAVSAIVGTHDFIAFSSTGRPVLNSVRTIFDADIVKEGEFVTLTVTGNGFLYNMMRIIAGTVAFVGLGLLPPDTVEQAFEKKDRTLTGMTFPPQGLTLLNVEFKS